MQKMRSDGLHVPHDISGPVRLAPSPAHYRQVDPARQTLRHGTVRDRIADGERIMNGVKHGSGAMDPMVDGRHSCRDDAVLSPP